MNILLPLLLLLSFLPSHARAHGDDNGQPHAHIIPAATEMLNRVRAGREGNYLVIESNGIPDHATGQFPNAHNPNTISAHNHVYRIPLNPVRTRPTSFARNVMFGVALNGIPFDPATAEFYNNDPRSGWDIEALTGDRDLGLDDNNAHVQPDGTYHYHAIPWALVKALVQRGNEVHDNLVLVGYAADGFPVYAPAKKGKGPRPSYKVKIGTRPSGPGGEYDGTYTQDWDYIAGSGDLDICNGGKVNGSYAYVLSEEFPFIPRCFMGAPDKSFVKAPPAGGPGHRRPGGPPGGSSGGMLPPPR